MTAQGHRMVLASGRTHPELAHAIAEELGTKIVPMDAHTFANGELYIRFGESVRGADVFAIQAHAIPINRSIMEHLIMVDAHGPGDEGAVDVTIEVR